MGRYNNNNNNSSDNNKKCQLTIIIIMLIIIRQRFINTYIHKYLNTQPSYSLTQTKVLKETAHKKIEGKQLLYFHSYLLRVAMAPVMPPLFISILSFLFPLSFCCCAPAFISRHLTKAKSSHIVY